ncbi:MAG: NAD-binding protein [Bacteroidota bacterium]|nr:NAD-binding protein [Bacteroidota bacterium]
MASYKITLGQRVRYYFDNVVMQGTASLIAALFLIFLLTALVTAVILFILNVQDDAGVTMSFHEAYWTSLMHVIDQGTLTGDDSWHLRLATLITTFIGIFLVSSLVSILNTGFSEKIEELKKGRSMVLEENHTVILGWSNKVYSIVNELRIANENQFRSCVVILADENIDMMKDDLKQRLGNTGKMKVIFRHGNPRDPNEIMVANLNTAKSIIIMQPDDSKSDAYVIKTIMAIVNNAQRKEGKYNIIAEIKDEVNREIAKIVGKDEVTVVVSNDIISKITVQTSRQAGLSVIYGDLIDFDGVEMYILPVKNLAGHTFQEALFAFEDVIALGIRKEDGQIILSPPLKTVFGINDKLIVIAEDDNELEFKPKHIEYQAGDIDKSLIRKKNRSQGLQKTLILGWNRNLSIIVRELDNYVENGSEVLIVAEGDNLEEQVLDLDAKTPNQRVKYKKGDINDKAMLNKLDLAYYDYIIILSYSDTYGTQEADAITLITLMYIRDIGEKMGKSFNIVSEMLDIKNRDLADASKADDFIISDQIISLVLAQLSENNELSAIFEDLFDADGLEIYLKPASNYVKLGEPIDFYHIVDMASRKKETALGYRLKRTMTVGPRYGVVLNPMKSEKVSYEEGDLIIVLAEE